MEYIAGILLGFITLSFLLKIGFYPSFRQIALAATACAGFVLLIWNQAAEQSRTQIADFLASPKQMQDAAVWITLEAMIMIAFCFDSFAGYRHHDNLFKRSISCFLNVYPGLLIGVVLGYALTQTIFAFPGTDFRIVAGWFAASAGTGIALTAGLFRKYLGDKGLRLELLFTTNLFILLMGIIATENGQTCYQSVSNVDWKTTVTTLIVFIAGAGLGFIWKLIHKTKL